MLVLTVINCENKGTLYDEAKTLHKNFKGGITGENISLG